MERVIVSSIVGKYFHSFDDEGDVIWQGKVLEEEQPGWYLIQLYDWLIGAPNECRLVSFNGMTGWIFYGDEEDWRDGYEKLYLRQKYRKSEKRERVDSEV